MLNGWLYKEDIPQWTFVCTVYKKYSLGYEVEKEGVVGFVKITLGLIILYDVQYDLDFRSRTVYVI